MKIEIPISNNDDLAIVYTHNVYDEATIKEIKKFLAKIDWGQKYIIVPSEYINRIEFVQR